MKVLILAAGYATRLFPLTLDKPKPLLLVGGKPIVEYIFDHISGLPELSEVFIVTNNKFFKNFQDWNADFNFKTKITILNDKTLTNDDRLGAIGDIRFFLKNEKVDEDLMVIAGDNLFNFEFKPFVGFAKEKNKTCIGVYDLPNKTLLSKYGVLSLDGNSKIIDFQEKPQFPKGTMISMGLYYFPKEEIGLIEEYIKEGGRPDQPGNYISWLSKKQEVYGFITKEDWYDIGDKVSLREARQKFSKA